MSFFIENPLFLVAVILIVLAALAKVISKPGKKKNTAQKETDKTAKKEENLTTETPAEISAGVTEKVEKLEDTEETKKEKKKLRRLKPEITKVYEKKELKPTDDSKTKILEEKSQKEEELLKSMQFVKSSKNIERLKPLTAAEIEEREKLRLEQEALAFQAQQMQGVDFFEEKIDNEHKVATHFDRTRRLSKMIKDDTFDDMFCSHISEKYMNMDDLEKHLRNCDEIHEKLFRRVAETIANSEAKVLIDDNGKIDDEKAEANKKSLIESRKREELARFMAESEEMSADEQYDIEDFLQDDVDLSARNILIVDAILKRKGKKNNI